MKNEIVNNIPLDDLLLTSKQNYVFKICRREKQGDQWIPIATLNDLKGAFNVAIAEPKFASIWIKTNTGFMVYWTNTEINLFNSTVLEFGEIES